MVQAQQPPDLKIPSSDNTVDVSVIDTTSYIAGLPAAAFIQPPVPGFSELSAPCFGFMIKHKSQGSKSKHDTMIFDLGVRKDFENGPASLVKQFQSGNVIIRTEKDVATTLKENGQDLNEVGAIIWSHSHFDHTGDPTTFPESTDLIVGPGFKEAFVPGYPTKEDSSVDERSWANRTLREIDFEKEGKGLQLGRYKALDFYGDGSFYLLDTPGHCQGHICGLARTSTSPDTFIFMGGDIAHHGGEFRPTPYHPIPDSIHPNPLYAPGNHATAPCPGAIFEAIHPTKSTTEPFVIPATSESAVHRDGKEAKVSIDKMTEFDAYENIFPVIAHDESLYDIVDFYPKPANDWKAKGWKKESFWRFLRDYDTGSSEHRPQWEPSSRKAASK